MKKHVFFPLPLLIVLSCCHPKDNEWATKDIFSIKNETLCKLTVEIQNWYPLPTQYRQYIVINNNYSDICNVFYVYEEDSIDYYTSIMMDISSGSFDSIVTLQNWKEDNPSAQQQRHYLPYGDIHLYNLKDTISFLFEGAPYYSDWMSCAWSFDGDAVNLIELVITDSLLSLMTKDYSMQEKFRDYYQ